MTAAEARAIFDRLLREVVRMLAAGLVHGDLSDFNVLMGADGPVLIDFPQSVDASRNQNARELLIRDVDNLTDFLGRFEPAATGVPYGQEMWSLYERGELTPDSVLTGGWQPPEALADTTAILRQIEEAELDEQRRRVTRGLPPIAPPKPESSPPQQNAPRTQTTPPAPRKKRRRRRRRGAPGGAAQAARPSS